MRLMLGNMNSDRWEIVRDVISSPSASLKRYRT